jgi:hypothetical protein
MPARKTSYRSRNPKRQTRLQFSSLPASSPNKKEYSTAVQNRLSRVTYHGARSGGSKVTNVARLSLSPESPSRAILDQDLDGSSPLSELPTPPTSSIPPITFEDEEDDEDDLVTPAAKRRKTQKASPENTTLSTPLRRSARIDDLPSNTRPSSSRSSRFSHVELLSSQSVQQDSDIGEAESTDEEAATALASVPTQRRRGKAPAKETYFGSRTGSRGFRASGRVINKEDWLVDDDEVEYISSGGDEVVAMRKQQKTPRSAKRKNRKEKEELEADLEDLRDSDADDSGDEEPDVRRTRGGPVTTQRDEAREHFELLKRRRAGEKIPRIRDSDDEQSEHGQDISYIGQPSQDFSEEGSVRSSVETDLEEESAPATVNDVDDFIEEDDDERTGGSRRPRSDIPLEFTPWMTAKPRELFPHIIEWLVKNKIAPAFPRADPIFKLAFQRVNDQVAAQAGSRLISSAWNAEFKFTILARPEIAIGYMAGADEDRTCDACNRSNRPAKYDLVLTGSAYSMDTLEPIDKDSDIEDEEVDDASVDAKGHILAPGDRHFYLGSQCAANAQMGHKLTHWKYHLNETVLKYLEEQGVLSAEAIVARDKKSKRKREKEAEAIVDSMEQTGKIAELWREFQRDLKDAMLGMEDYTVRGGRSQGRIGVVRTRTDDGRTRVWNGDTYSEHITLSDSE